MTSPRTTIDHVDALAALSAVPRAERAMIEVRAPFTGAVIGQIPRGTPTDIERAVETARAAQPRWAALPVAHRARVFARFESLLLSRREELMDLIQLESGKARWHAFEEILDTAVVSRHYAVHAARYLRAKRHRGAFPLITRAIEVRHPVGVVGVIAPWNFPLILSITDAIAALLAGNSVVLRPDVQSSLTALAAAELLHDAGLPRDVLRVVTGAGEELGPPLVDRADFVMFTGSTRTGKIVAQQAAARLTGFSLELGGKNPMIVLDDADVDAAVDGAIRGAFVGAGQVCVSIERLYLPGVLHDAFVEKLLRRVRALRIGPAMDYSVDVGSMTSARQLAVVESHVADALAKGATLLAGGRRRPDLGPLFYEPTILAGVRPGMTAYAEETFGPVLAIYRYDDIDDAIARANDTRYGLNASVWSRSSRRAVSVARRIRCGTVNVNEAYAASWTSTASPIGGMKESGVGRRHGAEGILKYTEAQTIAVQRLLPLAPPGFLGASAAIAVSIGPCPPNGAGPVVPTSVVEAGVFASGAPVHSTRSPLA
jgi:succinate-semialdehyde dehydrogenase/glutarate-semialdehyde dehydrogenase